MAQAIAPFSLRQMRRLQLGSVRHSSQMCEMPLARRELGDDSTTTIKLLTMYGILTQDDPSREDLVDAVANLEDAVRITRRKFGEAHPFYWGTLSSLETAVQKLVRMDEGATPRLLG